MSSSRQNIDILQKISDYCIQIQNARKRFGDTLEALKTDNDYRNAVAGYQADAQHRRTSVRRI